jgi:hypothetical protein
MPSYAALTVANAYPGWLTKPNPNDALSSGIRVQFGDGTATPLFIGPSGIGTFSTGGYRHEFRSTATANRVVTFSDADGLVVPVSRALLANDVTSSVTSQAAVSGFSVPVAASGKYQFEMMLLVSSAAATTGFQFAVTGPSEIDFTTYEISQFTGTTLTTGNIRSQMLTSFGSAVANADAPAANTVFIIRVRGYLQTNGSSPSAPLGLTIASEVNASVVTLKAGSEITVTKRN